MNPPLHSDSAAIVRSSVAAAFYGRFVPSRKRHIVWVGLAALALIPFIVTGGATAPNIPLINLATEPLYAAVQGDKPTIALALSVEFPTTGAQYVGTPRATSDSSYSNANEYLGYYDAEACYTYNNAPTETVVSPLVASDYKRFDRTSAATSRKCTGETFSGNFLNWASSSAVDMLRMALSGGDRYIDTSTLTVLQRAVLPDSSVSTNFWNGSNFPAKLITKNGSGANDYWGAIPESMRTKAGTSGVAVANDKNRIYFATGGSSGTNNGSAGNYKLGGPDSSNTTHLNTDGFFYARVQVCNVSGTTLQDNRDFGLCKPYPNGNYKPTGAIQKYSDQLRLAAFGYMPQSKNNSAGGATFGGVLRAPMKYVGVKTFDITGVENTPSGGNPNAEWDANTGVFKTNPDGDTTFNVSGVINYLNKFGRLGTTQGLYKYYDPLGELYYETLRYLQGLQPTPAAIAGITTAMKDGFPVFTSWTDPYGGGRTPGSADYSCLKSNIVTIGDVNIDSSGTSRYPAASASGNVPDLAGWLNTVKKFESNTASTYVDGQGVSRTTGNPNGSNTATPTDLMIGAAYWAHTHDIRGTNWTGEDNATTGKQRPGLRVKSYAFDVNEFAEQSVDSTRRNANELFHVAKYGGFQADPANIGSKPYNTFGNPFKQQNGTDNNDVWRDPTRLGPNGASGGIGEASTYYLQSNARGVLSAFDAIFGSVGTAANSIAGAAVQNKNLTTTVGSTVYQASFDTNDWTGDVISLPVTISSSNVVAVGTVPTWSATAKLAALSDPAASRKIFVGRAGATSSPAAASFVWANVVGTSLETDLNKLTPSTASDGLAQDRLNYLRGNKIKEGNPFRVRNNKYLGDIVNSGLAYSGAPSVSITGTGYSDFVSSTTVVNRTPAVFVGVNDGMLHAFNATTGDELFGYIPSAMGPKLAALTDNSYATSHQSYVDGTPAVSEAKIGTGSAATDWKTVLVSGMGAGAQGVFALDITDPSTFAATNVMWEFTHNDDVDMGNVVGRVQILKLQTNATGTPVYRWFAAVPGGVNNYATPVGGVYSDGNPTLFLLALDKAAGAAWAEGSNYYKIKLPFDSTLATTKPTGLINFTAVRGFAGDVTAMYMGDLHGKVWKLNFVGVGASDWNMAKLTAFDKDPDATAVTPYPLYIAKDGSGNTQPISMAPTVAYGPTQSSFYVYFGTGKYLEKADKITTSTQSVYAVYDNGTNKADSTPIENAASVVTGRGRLQAGTVTTSTFSVTFPTFKWGRASADSDATQRSGWYFDYVATGERQITNFDLKGTKLLISSLYPGASGGANSCTAAGGGGNNYTLDALTGNGSYTLSNVGIPGPPLIFELPGLTLYSDRDSAGRRTKTVTAASVKSGALGFGTTPELVTNTLAVGRLSWRQINNYQDLKNAP